MRQNLILKYIVLGSALFTLLFLSRKIIDIPNGTHSGGVIGASGVAIIGIVMFGIIFLTNKIIARKKGN